MSAEENLRALDRWTEAYNAHDFDGFGKEMAESIMYMAPNFPQPLSGRENVRNHFARHPAMFPDTQITKERSFGQGDWVCVAYMWTATHKGPISTPDGKVIPPTNKSIRIPFVIVMRFERGQIAEAREYWDQLAFLSQLGLARG